MADSTLLPRNIQSEIETALQDTPVVCVLGARQVGKSTLVQAIAPGRPYVNLDEEPFLNTASADPAGFIQGLPETVTIDEVQRAPELMRAIKVSVDRNRKPGRFLLTGSANLLLLPQLTESLAGRMEIVRMNPLTESEKAKSPGLFLQSFLNGDLKQQIQQGPEDGIRELIGRILAGGYPEALNRSPERAHRWQSQYIESILEKDVKDVARVQNVDELGRLLQALACQSGNLLNVSNLSRDLGIVRATVDHYIAVLQRLYLVRLLPAWHSNHAKRLVKSPKAHIPDSGTAAHLMGLVSEDWIPERKRFGNLMESFVVQQLATQSTWTDPSLKLYHYRDKDGVEVDCVISKGSKVWGIEVKASQSISKADAKGLRRLTEQVGDQFQSGAVLYTGSSTFPLDSNNLAVPMEKLWKL